jgi:hypothetical protein
MSRIHGSSRRSSLHGALTMRLRVVCIALLLPVALGACRSTVQVAPEQVLPRALLQPMTARAGLLLDEELRGFHHEETRGGGSWRVQLGAGHDKLFRSIFGASFSGLQVFTTLDAARAAGGLQVIFRPQIEQFSFATARETSGAYWAVTIRYRIAVLGPQGEAVDALSLTGYGSALGAGRSAASLTAATRAAMRDAAAKFLVQMPRQSLAQKLLAGQSLSAADTAAVSAELIEAVPIEPADASG